MCQNTNVVLCLCEKGYILYYGKTRDKNIHMYMASLLHFTTILLEHNKEEGKAFAFFYVNNSIIRIFSEIKP